MQNDINSGITPQNGVRYSGPKFAMIPEWVLFADISANAVRAYCVLRRYADANDFAYPSRRALAERMKIKDRRTVDVALVELVEVGALMMYPRWRNEAGEIVEHRNETHRIRTSHGFEIRA